MGNEAIAIFGGAFNPPTLAHINLAKQILHNLSNIKKIIFVPVSTKYNKSGLAEDKDRFNMLKTICKEFNNIEVSDIELKSSRQLFTIETLDKIQEQNKNKKIFFIIGTDNLKQLDTWHNVDKLLEKYKVIVLKRNDDNISEIINNSNVLSNHRESIVELKNIKPINLSSTHIREKLKKGEDISKLVPPEIAEKVVGIYKN